MKEANQDKETVLVTGGAGYIGSHVVCDLAAAGYFPLVVDNLSTGNRDSLLAGELVEGDISDSQLVARLIRNHGIQNVLHFAAFIEVEESVRNPLKFYQNNSLKSLSLIQTCIENGVKHFLFSSTAAVYGIPEKMPVDENTPLLPINPYGRSKLITEMILKDAAMAHLCFQYVSLRYFNVAGADPKARIGQNYRNPTHLITRALKTAMGVYPEIQIFGKDYPTPDGTAIRDYIHIDDLSAAHLLALKYLKEMNRSEIFNCGYGKGYSVLEVITSAKRITGIDFPVVEKERRPGDPPCLVADSRRIQQTLGWKPRMNDLDIILETAWKWEKELKRREREALLLGVDKPAV